MTPTQRLTTALRGLADALEGPLPCSDPEMPARRLLDRINDVDNFDPLDVVGLLERLTDGTDPLDALCDAGLCDE